MFGCNITYNSPVWIKYVKNGIFQTGPQFTALKILKQYYTSNMPELSQLTPVKCTASMSAMHPLSN